MQFTTDAVQTVKVVELVMVELLSDSSKQWSLIKIQTAIVNTEACRAVFLSHQDCRRGPCAHTMLDLSFFQHFVH